MTGSLIEHLTATRDELERRSKFGLRLGSCDADAFVRRFNTFLALAKDQDEELAIARGEIRRLHLALLIVKTRQSADVCDFPEDRIVRRFPTPSDGGDAA